MSSRPAEGRPLPSQPVSLLRGRAEPVTRESATHWQRRPPTPRTAAAPYTSATHCRLFARQLRARGIDPAFLLDRVELTRAEIERLDVLMPTHKFLSFLRGCEEATHDANLGLHAGEQARIEDLDILGLVLRGSPFVRDAYDLAQQHRGLWCDVYGAELALAEEGVVCRQSSTVRRATPRQWGEYFAAVTVALARAVVGPTIDACEVRFVHAAPECTAEHRRVFGGARLSFGARSNEVVFSAQLLERPLAHADASVVRVLMPHLQKMSAAAPTISAPDLAARVRNVALENLADGRLSIREVARKLHQSERTLSRQLSAAATTFREILNELRRDLALHYLEQGLSAVEMSRRLGFAEPNTFHRAFRRWTGGSVGEYRRRGASPVS